MLLTGNLKQTTVLAGVDFCLKRSSKTTKRCVRNLMELGNCAYPNKLTEKEKAELSQQLMEALENQDLPKVKALFMSAYIES